MVTEFAKEMIKNAESCGAQDIYVIPRQDNYELYMRVGQERRLIDVYRPDFMASLIGHFKFVAGMMVGEKRRSQLGSCDYDCGDGQRVSLRLSTVGDYRGLESLVIRVLHSERRELVYWNQGISLLWMLWIIVAYISLQVPLVLERLRLCMSWFRSVLRGSR